MLWLLAEEMRVRIRENEDSVQPVDGTDPPPDVSGQTRVASRIYVSSANILSEREAGFRGGVRPAVITPEGGCNTRLPNRKGRGLLLGSGRRAAVLDLFS